MSQITCHHHATCVERMADRIEAELAQLPPVSTPDTDPAARIEARNRYHEAVNVMVARLVNADGNVRMKITRRSDGYTVRSWGLTASSTAGAEAALRNWVTQARAKVGTFRARHGKERA